MPQWLNGMINMPPIWKPTDPKTLRYYIDTILEEAEDKLNDWERNFIDSIDKGLERYGKLSQRQEEILERIYADKTS